MQATLGKLRALQSLSHEGVFRIAALDHRDSLRAILPAAHSLGATKLALLASLGGRASGVMLDPEHGIGPAIRNGAIPPGIGFVAALEEQGYLGDESAAATRILPGWSVAKAKLVGAAGVKLLVLCGERFTPAQVQVIEAVVADCTDWDIPLFLEPLARAGGVPAAVVEQSAGMGADVLKLPAGVDVEPVNGPWALLSGGASFDDFCGQLREACAAGCSGYMAGRAVWGDVITGAAPAAVVAERLAELNEIAGAATPFGEKIELPDADAGWYTAYRRGRTARAVPDRDPVT